MGAEINNKGLDLHALAEPSFFKPYIIVNDKGHLESTHVIRWFYEKICGASGGVDMCNSKLVGLSLLYEVQDLSKAKKNIDVEDVNKILVRAGLIDSPKSTSEKSNTINFLDSCWIIDLRDILNNKKITGEEKSMQLKDFSMKYYSSNEEILKKYKSIIDKSITQIDSKLPALNEKNIIHLKPTKEKAKDKEVYNVNNTEIEESDSKINFQQIISDAIAEIVDEVKELKVLANAEKISDEDESVNFSESEEYQHLEFGEDDYEYVELINPDDEIDEEEKILNSGISARVCRKVLENLLIAQNKAPDPQTRDDGDCFYDAFARGLSKIKGEVFTVQDLRDSLKKEVNRLNVEDPSNNWIKVACENDVKKGGIDDYQKYLSLVGTSYQTVVSEMERRKENGEVVENTIFPPWGRPEIDGELLCNLYGVKLKLISVEVIRTLEEVQPPDTDLEKYFVNKEVYPTGKKIENPAVVEIAAYPGHFMAVKTLRA